MALNINGRMKVKTLRADFKKEFGLSLRVYDGRSFADDDATLASIRKGDSKGGEFAPRKNTKVGNLEDKIMDMFGIKTQVSGSDDSYLCDNDLTLTGALEADERKMGRKEKTNRKEKEETSNIEVETEGSSEDDNTNMDVVTLVLYVNSLFDDAVNLYTEEQGYDNVEEYLGDLEEESIEESIAGGVFYALATEYIKYTVADAFDVRVSHRDNIEGIYVKVGDDFVNLDNAYDIDWFSYDMAEFVYKKQITVYFVLKEPMPHLEEIYFFKLSEMIVPFALIVKIDSKIVSQIYDGGEYDSGYLCNGADDYYIYGTDKFSYSSSVASRSDIVG